MKNNNNNRTLLSPHELEVLRWVREGKTNGEIAVIIGKSKWAVKYHLGNLMKKLGVGSRTQAVSEAIERGLLDEDGHADEKILIRVGLVGCGSGGAAVLDVLKDNPLIRIVGIAENDPRAVGVQSARELDIQVFKDYRKLLERGVDVIINLTDSSEVTSGIRKEIESTDIELMGGLSAMLMWQLADERRKRQEDKERVLKEHETLYHLGLIIENIDSMADAGYSIVDYATKLLNMPAGSLAIFDEKRENMKLVAAKGFTSSFKKVDRWEIRKGGLTSNIFNQSGPYFLSDIKKHTDPNPLLIKEGVRSILAAPLTVEGRIIGILYVNDFKKREMRAEDISIFSLISVYAALTIERVKSIEDMRMLSIVDGLTGLYNHRYIMEQMQKEQLRAERHEHNFSVIMLDIDNFKSYNDNFGHLEGNKVLKELSDLFKKTARVTDTVGRFGGEEFCIVVPELEKKEAALFASRVVETIAAHEFPNRQVTASGGVATFPEDGRSCLDLIEKADERLYEAKRSGKSRICS